MSEYSSIYHQTVCLKQIGSEVSKCMPTLKFLMQSVKQQLFPMIHTISLKSSIRMSSLDYPIAKSNFIPFGREKKVCQRMKPARFFFPAGLVTPSQGQGPRKWYKMEVNNAYKHCMYDQKKKKKSFQSLRVMSYVKASAMQDGRTDEHD